MPDTKFEARYAGAYLRLKRVFVHSTHETLSGADYVQDDDIAVSVDDFEGIGKAARTALASYREGVPIPEWGKLGSPNLYSLAGVSSWSAFRRGAKCVSIKSTEEAITITPSKKNHGGYVWIKGQDKLVAYAAPDADLGLAIVDAFKVSTSA